MDIVIPTRFDRDTLAPLINECLQVGRVILIHTEPGHAPVKGTVTLRSEARNIHTWWNLGLDACDGPALVLNDDIVTDAPDILALFLALDDTDLVYAAGRGGPMPLTGWCFGLHPDKIRPDPAFTWWYPDDDLWKRAVAEGLSARAVALKNTHHERPGPRFGDPAMKDAAERDAALFRSRWGN